jgi:hypothetical protein
MVFEFEKKKQGLIYVPRFNAATNTFESALNLPDATDLLANPDKYKEKSHSHSH